MNRDDELLDLRKLKEELGEAGWPFSLDTTYMLARVPRDGRAPLKTIRVNRRKFTTRRLIAEFYAARTQG
jgi:hypothetical protein